MTIYFCFLEQADSVEEPASPSPCTRLFEIVSPTQLQHQKWASLGANVSSKGVQKCKARAGQGSAPKVIQYVEPTWVQDRNLPFISLPKQVGDAPSNILSILFVSCCPYSTQPTIGPRRAVHCFSWHNHCPLDLWRWVQRRLLWAPVHYLHRAGQLHQ